MSFDIGRRMLRLCPVTVGGDEASAVEQVDTKRGRVSKIGNFLRNSQVLPQIKPNSPLKNRGVGVLSR